MKKILFGSTALVAVAFAGVASARDVELGLGGYMRVGVAFSDFKEQSGSDSSDEPAGDPGEFGDDADESIHVIRDGEIHFRGSGTLDNGLRIDTRVELEAYTHDNDQIDENWVRVRSSFGTILIGANDDAAYNAGYVGMSSSFINHSWYDHTLTFTPVAVGSNFTLVGGSDQIGVHYYTPTISGFSAGISYHPSATSDAGDDAQATGGNNDAEIISIGGSYRNSFGDVSFAVGGGYIMSDAEEGAGNTIDVEADAWGVGVEVGFAGFTVFGRYEEAESEPDGGVDTEFTGYALGASYETGPWRVAGGYGYQDSEQGSSEDEMSKISVGVEYELGDGVVLGGGVEWAEAEESDTEGSIDEDGFSGALLLGVSF